MHYYTGPIAKKEQNGSKACATLGNNDTLYVGNVTLPTHKLLTMTALSILATCLAAAMSIKDVGAFTNELDVCRRIRNKSCKYLCLIHFYFFVFHSPLTWTVYNTCAAYDPLSKKTSFTSSVTSLSYKNQDNDAEQRSTKLPPRISKKKYKKSKNKLSYRSLDKKGIPTTEHELAQHVQTVFSDLPEFSDSDTEEDEDDEPCILSDPVEEEDNINASSREQLDSCKKLDRHPALVLNADYQVYIYEICVLKFYCQVMI